uniref:Vps54_N domain-containing protein n=1 Tax=Schistosoma mansoni TaxID=6183 RepID=A0A5K4EDW5_SCHMA
MDKILRLVSQRSKILNGIEEVEKSVSSFQPPTLSKQTSDRSIDSPNPTRDPHVMQELINNVEDVYYSMTFDSGKYEIENIAGPNCRELSKLKLRLLALDRQNKAVSRRVSELVLEKHPQYEAELKGVLSLQSDNWETLCMCREIRNSLKQADKTLVLSRLIVLRNHRRQLRLKQTLNILFRLRNLQNNVQRLDTLIKQGDFYDAIQLHRESLVLLEDFRSYRCIESIHSKLKASELRIDEKLDSELQRSCEHFDEKSYSTVQRAFELLGSTQTTFAQLQMHYVAAIQPSQSDTSGNKIITNYSYPELCQQLPHWTLLRCLRSICQNMWEILLCYHRTIQWHKNRASGKSSSETYPSASSHTKHKSFTSNSLLSNSKYHKPKLKVDNNDRDDIVVTTEIDQDSSTVTKSYVNINNDHGCDPQLARQWHDYVTCKLDSGRSRIWSEIISRIEPILNLVSQFARDMTFDQIASLLSTINHFVHIGEEFCECSPNELLEALRISIQKYFKDFHRKHMDRLKMFLENETWKICPVKHSFTVMDLQEFRAVKYLFETNTSNNNITNNSSSSNVNKSITVNGLSKVSDSNNNNNNSTVIVSKLQNQKLFAFPYTFVQFPEDPENSNNNDNSNNNNVNSNNHLDQNEINSPNLMNSSSASADIRQQSNTKFSSNNNDHNHDDHDNHGNINNNDKFITISPNDFSNDTSFSNEHSGPLLSTTTLEVLRLIGRYLQMMRLLQPIAGEVMHCLCQVFDYYLYSILNLFGPIQISNSSEFPERLRTTIKRINERLITADNHQSILTGDRFSLPLHGPIELLHALNPTDNNPAIGDNNNNNNNNNNKREHQLIQIYVVAVESVIFLADILETVLLPHLTACLPDNKRGLALVFREQSLMAARQIREPCANELAPHLLNIIITKMTDVTAKNCKQLPATNNAPITSSFSKIWPIGSNTNQQQQTIDKESSIPNNNNTNSSSPTSIHNNLIVSTTDSIDILTMHICAMNWLTKEVANTPNSYVYDININVFHPLSLILQNISKEFHLKDHIFMIVIWKALLSCLASQLLEALSRVQQCSDEGRGQMLLDIQTLAVYAQSASKIRSFPRLDYVIEYIQAFYIPIHEWEHWLTNYGTKYSRSQLTGLASCLSRSDKRQYQRLINTLNQIYNTTNQINSFGNGLLTTTSS